MVSSPGGSSSDGSARTHALVAIYASVPLALVIFWWFHEQGLVASTPYWILFALIVVTGLLNYTSDRWLEASRESQLRLHTRFAVCALSTTAVIYAVGWGPMLGIAYLVSSAELLQEAGARSWRPALAWSAAGVLAGQVAIGLGWAPSMLELAVGNAVAVSGVICLAIVTRVLGVTTAAAEAAEIEVRERGELFGSLIQHAIDVIGVLEREGVVRFASPAIEGMLGRPPSALEGAPFATLLVPGEWDRVGPLVDHLAGRPGWTETTELRLRHADGGERLAVATFTGRAGKQTDGVVVVNLHDVTTQHELEEQLRHDAMHDPLTGLWNRAAFTHYAERACTRATREGSVIALLFVDLDDFKRVNDTLGHELGDEMLVDVARRLEACLRGGEVVARLGGDEFTVLLEAIPDAETATGVAERILDALGACGVDGRFPGPVSASVGIALNPGGRFSLTEMLRQADGAMYCAKRTPRSAWELVGP